MTAIPALIIGVVWVVFATILFAAPLAIFLRMACSLLGEKTPTFPQALQIGAMSFWVQFLPLLLVRIFPVWLLLWPVMAVPLAATVYATMLPMRYPRAVSLALAQVLIVGGGIALMTCLFIQAGWRDPLVVLSETLARI